jgi:hypothetical protein
MRVGQQQCKQKQKNLHSWNHNRALTFEDYNIEDLACVVVRSTVCVLAYAVVRSTVCVLVRAL